MDLELRDLDFVFLDSYRLRGLVFRFGLPLNI